MPKPAAISRLLVGVTLTLSAFVPRGNMALPVRARSDVDIVRGTNAMSEHRALQAGAPCWSGAFTAERCCDVTRHGGDSSCWAPPDYTFASCCDSGLASGAQDVVPVWEGAGASVHPRNNAELVHTHGMLPRPVEQRPLSSIVMKTAVKAAAVPQDVAEAEAEGAMVGIEMARSARHEICAGPGRWSAGSDRWVPGPAQDSSAQDSSMCDTEPREHRCPVPNRWLKKSAARPTKVLLLGDSTMSKLFLGFSNSEPCMCAKTKPRAYVASEVKCGFIKFLQDTAELSKNQKSTDEAGNAFVLNRSLHTCCEGAGAIGAVCALNESADAYGLANPWGPTNPGIGYQVHCKRDGSTLDLTRVPITTCADRLR